jgi:hypothetical protein
MPQLIMPNAPEFPLILLRVAFAAPELISESVQTLKIAYLQDCRR